MRKLLGRLAALPLLLALFSLTAVAQDAVVLVGSGSSVPAPLYSKWTDAFNKRKPSVQVRYLPTGTSEGIANIEKGSGDFAAGESQLSAKDKASLVEIPSVVIGIVPIYNLPGGIRDLKFSGELLAEIYLGTVKTWNAPQIAKLNPGVSLPDMPIKVVYRPAGKGSNYIFTEFLSKTSPKFRSEIGISPSPKWPVGTAAERSSDMADKVKADPGAIGYVEAQYALKANLPVGLVLNPAGKYVKGTDAALLAACHAVEAPSWDKFSAALTNAPGADSDPIASFTWLYLRTGSSDAKRAAALSEFLGWVYSDGQKLADQDGYSALPPELLAKVKAKVANLH